MCRCEQSYHDIALQALREETFVKDICKTQTIRSHMCFQAFLSLVYLTSSNIFALINYTGFATWVSKECLVGEMGVFVGVDSSICSLLLSPPLSRQGSLSAVSNPSHTPTHYIQILVVNSAKYNNNLQHILHHLTFTTGCFSGSALALLPMLLQYLCSHQLCRFCHLGKRINTTREEISYLTVVGCNRHAIGNCYSLLTSALLRR